MQATPVEYIRWVPTDRKVGKPVQFDDEFLSNFLENMKKADQHMEEVDRRMTEYVVHNKCAELGIRKASLKMVEGLLARNRVHVFPCATVAVGDKERVIELVVGATVAKVRARCNVPAGWQAVVDEEPVSDDYSILRDGLFDLARRKGFGRRLPNDPLPRICQQREDPQDWISVSQLRKTMLAPDLRKLSEKQLRTLFRRERIRVRNPMSQRLEVHCGDWLHFLARHAQYHEDVLDAAADRKAIGGITTEMDTAYEDCHRQKQKKDPVVPAPRTSCHQDWWVK